MVGRAGGGFGVVRRGDGLCVEGVWIVTEFSDES